MHTHLAKRIIPCLDIDCGRVVKGINFVNIRDAGDPVEIAIRYNEQGADEITFLDITASVEKRNTTLHMVEKVAAKIFIPLTVGGGVSNLQNIRDLLNAGADKVAINSAAVKRPEFVQEASDFFGNQCIVVAIDAKQTAKQNWRVFTHGGRRITELDAIEWAKKMQDYGAGELLITSMDKDGTKTGFDNQLLKKINQECHIPTIASGGVGTLQHLLEGITIGKADAVLAASIFHFGEYQIADAKNYLKQHGIHIR